MINYGEVGRGLNHPRNHGSASGMDVERLFCLDG